MYQNQLLTSDPLPPAGIIGVRHHIRFSQWGGGRINLRPFYNKFFDRLQGKRIEVIGTVTIPTAPAPDLLPKKKKQASFKEITLTI